MDKKIYGRAAFAAMLVGMLLAVVLCPGTAHSFETAKNALKSGSTPAAYVDYVNATKSWTFNAEATHYHHQFAFTPYFENSTGNYTYPDYANATAVNGTFGIYGDDGDGDFKHLTSMTLGTDNGTAVEVTGWFKRLMVQQVGDWQGSSAGSSFFVFPRYKGGR